MPLSCFARVTNNRKMRQLLKGHSIYGLLLVYRSDNNCECVIEDDKIISGGRPPDRRATAGVGI